MYLSESEFYDYKTAPVTGSDVVDLYKTGIPYYDDFLSNNEQTINYLKTQKNLEGTVVWMSPNEYFQSCSDYGFPNNHPSVQSLKQSRAQDTKTIEHLKNVLTVYKRRFPMPVLNKADAAQEGLHRMYVVGELFGWEHKVPVLVVDWADKQRAYEDAKQQRKRRIEHNIQKAVNHALLYKFTDLTELREQLQWELDKIFDYDSDVDTPVIFELTTTEDEFIVSVGNVNYEFNKDLVTFTESPEDDLDIEDLESDVDEDFLKRYFGDDWRKTHPHLKDLFHVNESVERLDIKQMNEYILKEFGSVIPGDGCIFIAPEGTFINIYPKLDDHEDLCYWLEEHGFKDTPDDAEWFVDEFKYIRCRNSPHMCFIHLPEEVTTKQLNSLEEWLETKVFYGAIQIAVPDGKWRKYDLKKYFPEDIIKIIRRYYSSGTLYEKLI